MNSDETFDLRIVWFTGKLPMWTLPYWLGLYISTSWKHIIIKWESSFAVFYLALSLVAILPSLTAREYSIFVQVQNLSIGTTSWHLNAPTTVLLSKTTVVKRVAKTYPEWTSVMRVCLIAGFTVLVEVSVQTAASDVRACSVNATTLIQVSNILSAW